MRNCLVMVRPFAQGKVQSGQTFNQISAAKTKNTIVFQAQTPLTGQEEDQGKHTRTHAHTQDARFHYTE